MRRYVILSHDHPVQHWDLMFESGAVLRTWRLEAVPEAGVVVAAEAIADHRRAYLDYEGPVSGGRGTVTRWETGTFELLDHQPGRLVARVTGVKLCGLLTLNRKGDQWVCLFEPSSQG